MRFLLRQPFLLASLIAIAVTVSLGTGQTAAADPIRLSFDQAQGAAGTRVKVPLRVKDADQLGPVQLIVKYDAAVLRLETVKPGSLARSAMLHQESPEPGTLRLALITDKAITGDGDLMNIEFTVLGESNASCPLRIPYAQAWEWRSLAQLLVDTQDATFAVAAPWWANNWVIAAAIALVLIVLLVCVVSKRSRTPATIRS